MILSTTLIIVLSTVMVFGGGTVQLLQRMKIRVGVKDDEDEGDPSLPSDLVVAMDGHPKSCLASSWQGFDKKYMRPVMVHTDRSQGVDNMTAVFRTVRQYWRGEPESYAVEVDPFADSDDGGGSDADSTASSELLDFDDDDDEADAFSGDIGRSSTTSPPRSAFFKGFEPMGVPGSTA